MTLPSDARISSSTALSRLLELTAVLGAGDHGRQVEGDDPLVGQRGGDIAVGDAPGQPLDDGGLPDSRLADEDRVVLGAPRQHLDHATDLLVAPDHRVELLTAGQFGQVPSVLLEGVERRLGVGRGDTLCSTDRGQRLEQPLAVDPQPPQFHPHRVG